MKLLSLLCFVFLIPSMLLAEMIVRGTIKTAEGEIPEIANVELSHIGEYVQHLTGTVNDRGEYEITVAEPGLYSLWFSAPYHQTAKIPLIIDEDNRNDQVKLEVILKPMAFKSSFDSIEVLGSWNNMGLYTAIYLVKQNDGRYVNEFEVEEDSVAYLLRGVLEDPYALFQGVSGDRLKYVGHGRYAAFVFSKAGKVKIVFDPSKLPHADYPHLPRAKFDENHKSLQEYFDMALEVGKSRQKMLAGRKDRNYCVAWGTIKHADNSTCMHKPPQMQMLVFRDDSMKEILTETAPKWGEKDSNIPGNGYVGIELGNFQNPSLAEGDSFTMIVTDLAAGERAVFQQAVGELPANYGVRTDIQLNRGDFPPAPQNVEARFTADGATAVVSWIYSPEYSYSVYRRSAESPGRYELLAGNISAGNFKDRSFNKESAYSYIVIAKNKSGTLSPHSAEVGNIHISLDEQLANGKTEGIRQFAAIQIGREISMGYRADPDFGRRIFEIVPPASPYWAVETYLFLELSHYMDNQTADKLLWQFLRENPDRVTRGLVLARATAEAHATENPDKLAALYEELKTNYTDLKLFEIHFALRAYNPDKNVIAGNHLPDFQLSLLNSDKIVTKESLMGRYYLIDFWATWCGPCVAEMPNLHEVYKKFKDKNFTILSISFDRKPEHIQKFRENKWKMPWQHVFVDGEEKDKLSDEFEVFGIPKPILVGPDGVILAIEGELRGTLLEQTLSKYLGDDDTSEGDVNK